MEVRSIGNVARLGETKYKQNFIWKSEGKKPLGRQMQIDVRGSKRRKWLNSGNICGLVILYDCKLN